MTGAGATGPIRLAPEDIRPRPIFRAALAALELAELLRAEKRPLRMLDVGGAHGIHARFFREAVPDLTVDVQDFEAQDEPLIHCGDYLSFSPDQPYDVIWCAHVLEHVRNTGLFLDKMRADLAENGLVAISVPPHVDDRGILEHLTTWDPMLLIINLVNARFDCREGRFARYGYNISGIARKTAFADTAALEDLTPDLPRDGHRMVARFKFNNWRTRSVRRAGPQVFPSVDECLAHLNSAGAAGTGFFETPGPKWPKFWRLDPGANWLMAVN